MGLAGLIGGVAVGVTLGARQLQRSRRPYVDGDIHELRERLHSRFAEVAPLDGDHLTATM